MALAPGATRMSRHTLRGPLPLFLDRTLDRGPRYATVDPKWTLEPSCEDFDPAAVESDSASELWPHAHCMGHLRDSKEDHSGKITINYQFFGVIVGVSVNAAFCNLLKYFNSVYGCDRRACLHLSLCKHDLSPIQQNLCKAHCFSNSKSCKSHFLCECFTCHREGEVEHNIPKILSENVWKICLASASFNRWGEGW